MLSHKAHTEKMLLVRRFKYEVFEIEMEHATFGFRHKKCDGETVFFWFGGFSA